MFLHLEETLKMDHSFGANFEGDEGNIMMAVLTHVKVLLSFSVSSLFKKVFQNR